MSKKTFEVTERGFFMEIDGKMVSAPIGHKFKSESDLATNNKCRVLEVATPTKEHSEEELAIRARLEELGGSCGNMKISTIEKKIAELEAELTDDSTDGDGEDKDGDGGE